VSHTDPPRRVSDLARRLADAFSEWWLGLDPAGVSEPGAPPDDGSFTMTGDDLPPDPGQP
jgi:hypothetical protein